MIKITDDLSLRLLKQTDAQAIFDIINRQRAYMREWLPFVDQTCKIQDTQNAVRALGDPSNPCFVILYKGNIEGLLGFKETHPTIKKTEIGYWLSQDCQGKGIMTSAVTKLLEYAFLVMNMNRVIIKVAVGNMKSRRIPERIGFIEEGIERESDMLVGGVYTDIVVYSMLKREYIENADVKIS